MLPYRTWWRLIAPGLVLTDLVLPLLILSDLLIVLSPFSIAVPVSILAAYGLWSWRRCRITSGDE